jgi:hypothetical protein
MIFIIHQIWKLTKNLFPGGFRKIYCFATLHEEEEDEIEVEVRLQDFVEVPPHASAVL